MIRVLFICHGNICRSPMAEFLFQDYIATQTDIPPTQFEVASAATSREEIGNPVYPPAKKKLASLGISCAGKTARQVTKDEYATFDYLLVMESYNLPNLMRIIGTDPDGKVFRLLDFADHPGDIADPWYTGDFDITHRDIIRGIQGFLAFLRKNKYL